MKEKSIVERRLHVLVCVWLSFVFIGCSRDHVAQHKYLTENVVVIVVDGPRYSETWGHPSHLFIPYMDTALAMSGVTNVSFYNNGDTYTTSGHTAITTGYYQSINNYGSESPANPSFLQVWRKQFGMPSHLSWLVTSKDKLEVLSDCADPKWNGQYLPSVNCGVNGTGIGSGYRDDSLTMLEVFNVLNTHQPRLLVINLRDPDYAGHTCNWDAYLQGIRNSDKYVYQLWSFIRSHPAYKGKTTLFVTNDHGRHLDGVADGFCSHGDGCDGCRHIHLFAYGPDFKQNAVVDKQRSLVDIHATILELLRFEVRNTTGTVMTELFK